MDLGEVPVSRGRSWGVCAFTYKQWHIFEIDELQVRLLVR